MGRPLMEFLCSLIGVMLLEAAVRLQVRKTSAGWDVVALTWREACERWRETVS